MSGPQVTSRKREPAQGDEEAGAELKLGEFQDVDALTHSEAALVINALVAKRKIDRKNVNDTEYVSYAISSCIHSSRAVTMQEIIWRFSMTESGLRSAEFDFE
jgi:DNA-directed RNA polymerase II subunit RPB4